MPSPLDFTTIRAALRAHRPRSVDTSGRKRAAVAVILRQSAAGPEVLLIKRAILPGDRWSGHMAFPGGVENRADDSLQATAIRETREEVGIDLTTVGELIGRLDEIQAIAGGRPTGMTIAPYVYALADVPHLRTNHEIDEAHWAPLGPMLRGETATSHPYERDGRVVALPAFDVDGRIVWGLTYQMLQSLFALLRAHGAL